MNNTDNTPKTPRAYTPKPPFVAESDLMSEAEIKDLIESLLQDCNHEEWAINGLMFFFWTVSAMANQSQVRLTDLSNRFIDSLYTETLHCSETRERYEGKLAKIWRETDWHYTKDEERRAATVADAQDNFIEPTAPKPLPIGDDSIETLALKIADILKDPNIPDELHDAIVNVLAEAFPSAPIIHTDNIFKPAYIEEYIRYKASQKHGAEVETPTEAAYEATDLAIILSRVIAGEYGELPKPLYDAIMEALDQTGDTFERYYSGGKIGSADYIHEYLQSYSDEEDALEMVNTAEGEKLAAILAGLLDNDNLHFSIANKICDALGDLKPRDMGDVNWDAATLTEIFRRIEKRKSDKPTEEKQPSIEVLPTVAETADLKGISSIVSGLLKNPNLPEETREILEQVIYEDCTVDSTDAKTIHSALENQEAKTKRRKKSK